MKSKLPFIAILIALPLIAVVVYLATPEPPEQEFSFRVSGNSMLPTMQPGDWVFAKRIRWEDLQAGMIATTTEGRVHRLASRDRFGWVLYGDNNPGSDRFLMTRKDYEAVVLYWQTHDGEIFTPEYAERFLE